MKVATIEPRRATNDQELAALVQHLTEQSKARRDYVVSVKDISAVVDEDEVKFSIATDMGMPMLLEPTYRAHETIWERLDIQKSYYNRMGDTAPDLLATNINYWAERDQRNFLVRIVDDKVRAFMSDRFRTLDSVELFFTCFDEVKNVGAKIVQADLTENKFYMKILHPEWAQKLDGFKMDMTARRQSRDNNNGPKYSILDHLDDEDGGSGTWLVPGIVVQNSDVGQGSLHAELFIFDLVCSNGMIGNRTIHQVHLGAQMDLGYVSYETRELEDRAIWSKVRDLVRASFDQEQFLAYVKKVQAATEIQLADPVEAVNLVVKNHGLDENAQQAILNELMSAGSNTAYGLLSAVTAVGRDKSNYDEGVKFERIGGDILEDPTEFVRVRRSARTARQIAKESR